MLAGFQWRERREWERTAWAVSMLMNVSGKVVKRQVRPRDLLPKVGRAAAPKADDE